MSKMTYHSVGVGEFSFDSDNKDQMEAFQDFMDAQADAWAAEVADFAKQEDIPHALASDIIYLRSRSRHTDELEHRILKCYRETGKRIENIFNANEDEELKSMGY